MAEKQYEKYIRPFTFTDDGYGGLRQVTRIDSETLGMDVIIEFGTFWSSGSMGPESQSLHKHDFNQVLYWFGADPADMSELNAEVELFLGEENERYMISCSTAVGIPAGMPHLPARIARMDKRFLFMTVSQTTEYKAEALPCEKSALESRPLSGFGSRHRNCFVQVPFIRKGAWSYGQNNPDDSGGHLGVINGKDTGFDFIIMCESLKKAPYRFGPIPDKPHVHQNPEILFFMGTDMNDLSRLGGEAEIALGKEMEMYTITRPSAVVVPGGLPHNPLTITKVDRPFIMTDVRPFGMEPPSSRTSPDL